MCSIESSRPSEPQAGRDLAGLEREITRLASHIHAATCRWLGLIAEFDRREGWAQWGCRSCAHWVSWRCGIAPVAAREHVRVAQRLQELPLIREAFSRGQLSYSKVRALTRVEQVSDEEELLGLARHATAAQLERLVRAYRGVIAVEERARGDRAERWLTWGYDDDGSLTIHGRLPGEEGALLVAALDAARDRLEEPAADDPKSASAEAHRLERHTASGASAEAPEHFHSAPGASAEAPRRTAGEARADALLMLADTYLGAGPVARSGGDRYQVVVRVDDATLRADGAGTVAEIGACELDDGVPLAIQTARRIACDASAVALLDRGGGRSPDLGRKRRTVSPALRRALSARDRGCRFPGCGSRRFVDNHHIRHWANGGRTNLGNLVQLCRHHHRLLHEGGYTVDGHPQGDLTFRRPDGRRISPSPRPPDGSAAQILRRPGGPRPAAEACVSVGAGAPFDLGLGVDALLAWTAKPPPEAAVAREEAVGV